MKNNVEIELIDFLDHVAICGGVGNVGKLGVARVDTLDKFGYRYWETC